MSIKNIRVVLVEPLKGGNVGAVCRAMKNMALRNLVLVNPAPEIADDKWTRKMAVSAIDVYEHRQEFPSLKEAVADCHAVAITTARTGLYRAHSTTPREWAPGFLEAASQGPVAVVFGRENHGVDNDELSLATHILQIPATKAMSSLNLAQAVLLIGYEIFMATDFFTPSEEQSPDAPIEMREMMFSMWEQAMLDTGFCKEDKLEHMMMGLRRVLTRGKLVDSIQMEVVD